MRIAGEVVPDRPSERNDSHLVEIVITDVFPGELSDLCGRFDHFQRVPRLLPEIR